MLTQPSDVLAGGGEMGALMRTIDWSRTPVGPVESWPQSLRTALSILLEAGFPMYVAWGPEFTLFYNDGYRPIFGSTKHPTAMGASARETFGEMWNIIGPIFAGVMQGTATTVVDFMLPLDRHGFAEECYYTFSYSPIRQENGQVGGVLVTVTETTQRVLGERRLKATQALAARTREAKTAQEACAITCNVLSEHPEDVPFALIHLVGPDGHSGFEYSVGVSGGSGAPTIVASTEAERRCWPFAEVVRTREAVVVDSGTLGVSARAAGQAFVLPVAEHGTGGVMGILVAGLSPARMFDAAYRDFLFMIASQIGTAIVSARAVEEAEARAATLAELDRTKTAFFPNVSHEFRTPLTLMLAQAPAAIAILRGPSHVFEMANVAYLELVNHREVIGKPVREALPEVEPQGLIDILDQVYRSQSPHIGRSLPLVVNRTDDGHPEQRFFDFVFKPLVDEHGRTEGIAAVVYDVTELTRARQEAETANRAKDEFLAMLGHELRNPLAPILTALQLLRLRGEPSGEREREIIERQVKHLVTLVDDLLDVSRITRGKIQLHRSTFELSEAVTRAIETVSPLFEKKRHLVQIEVPQTGLTVEGDLQRLAQIVANLLTNAAKYTEDGGRVDIIARAEGDEVVLRVRDSGIGIAPETLPCIFDLFVQERQAIDRAHGGLGLGLAIVRSLTELHGGRVEARSEGIGHGAEFILRLPRPSGATAPRVAAPSESRAAVLQATHPHRVLVVDDNYDAAAMLAEALTLGGHAVRMAHDGIEALRTAEMFRPNVALVDIGLPVMDGYEVAQQLAGHPDLRGIRLIAVTGYGQKQDRNRSSNAGFTAHLVKPVDLERLRELLESPSTPH